MKLRIAMVTAVMTVSFFTTGLLYAANGDLIVSGKLEVGTNLNVTGNIGVGTSSPASKLSVGGSGTTGTGIWSVGSNMGVYGSGTAYSGTGVMGSGSIGIFGSSGSINGSGVKGEITNELGGAGVYGIATAPLANGTGVRGEGKQYDFNATGPGVNYGATSSIRWKRNIKEVDNALGIVLGLRGVYYDWDAEHGGKHDIGFIGEEVGKYIPEIVVWDEKDTEYVTGMDYSKMTPVLLQAIKEQQNQIEALKAEVKDLRKILSKK